MTPRVDVIIPTFGRADRLFTVAENIHEATDSLHLVTFVVETDDAESVDAAGKLEADDPHVRLVINSRSHNYAGAINTAIRTSTAPYWFAGADDLRFYPEWFEAAVAHMDGWVMVVGTNDYLNPFVLDGLHATHYLVDRTYTDTWGGTIDQGPGVAMFEGYDHQFTDTEFVGVAKARCRFRPCLESPVEHVHFAVGKAVYDATYEWGQKAVEADRSVYRQRKQAWDNLVV